MNGIHWLNRQTRMRTRAVHTRADDHGCRPDILDRPDPTPHHSVPCCMLDALVDGSYRCIVNPHSQLQSDRLR